MHDPVRVGFRPGESGSHDAKSCILGDRLGRKAELCDADLGGMEYKTDLLGLVWQQISPMRSMDCCTGDKTDAYVNAPVDGSPELSGDCNLRVIRGASWFDVAPRHRSARRSQVHVNERNGWIGFRIARTL